MEHAGVSIDPGSRDLLEQDYQLGVDSNVELEVDDFDFRLDGAYQEVEHDAAEDVLGDGFALDADSKLGQGDEEAYAAAAEDEQAPSTKDTEGHTGGDAEAGVKYQDEIGYEDDDFVATDINVELSTAEQAVATDAGEPGVSSKGHAAADLDDATRPVDDTHEDASAHEKDESWHQDVDFEEHGEDETTQYELGGAEEERAPTEDRSTDLAVDDHEETAQEQHSPDHQDANFEDAAGEHARSSAGVPSIDVLYNEEYFTLFGSPEDDPDSYFLSDTQQLDRPLWEFLSALRAVVSEEISPTDELMVRFDPLDLEFGEQSNEKFLTRSFREVLDCHAALSHVPGISPEPIIHLMVRRDAEDQFLELLADAELVKGQSQQSEDSEMSDEAEENSPVGLLDDGDMQDEPFSDGNEDEYDEDVENIPPELGKVFADDAESKDEPTPEPTEDALVGEEEEDFEASVDASKHQTEELNVEESLEDVDAEAQSFEHEHTDTVAEEEQSWAEQAVEDDVTGFQPSKAQPHEQDHTEDAPEEELSWVEQAAEDGATGHSHAQVDHDTADEHIDQPTEEQHSNEFLEITEFTTVQGETTLEDDGTEHEADNDLILAFDDEHALSTIREEVEEYEEYTMTYDAAENVADGAFTHEPHQPEDAGEPTGADHQDQAPVTLAVTTASSRTSTTINGDEIDYEENDEADNQLAPVDDGAQMLAAIPGIDNDEIDWNDGDEEDQQPTSEDDVVEYEEPHEAAMTPSGLAGKRSRTDEEESLADETGTPGSPTHKRIRLC
ncbi:hypothetical protein N0V88_001834 [Collariella sp. IMI 366227]|nr:hypothetical protein N0V88_001834 [Collariella sp. IMI 366227]